MVQKKGGFKIWLRDNADMLIAALCALISSLWVPFDLKAMAEVVNAPLLMLLFCLMLAVAGLRRIGALTYAYRAFFTGDTTARTLSGFFIFTCFFSSMLITNDVALIIFVPLSIMALQSVRLSGLLIWVICLETVAANMGSMLTPVGNPQNLFIYSHYGLSLTDFIKLTLPTVLICGALLVGCTMMIPKKVVHFRADEHHIIPKGQLVIYLTLFVLCLLCVQRVIPAWALTVITVMVALIVDRSVFTGVHYQLLALFVFLFVLVGNLGRLPMMEEWPTRLLGDNEFLVSLVLSQIVSNVPATVMLSHYTDNAQALLLGVDVGGLGTLIASMASIISFRAYMAVPHSRVGHYLKIFTAVNLFFLVILVGLHYALPGLIG